MNRHISVHIAPHGEHYAVEKSVGGRKGRYLAGIASGLKKDTHGESVSANCIDSLCKQAQNGEVLLFSDVHGIKESEDIGILKHFEVMPNGDWYVEFRLHDEGDVNVDKDSIEKANKLWAQVNGLPPYTKPRQKGFSIEGYIPDDKILEDKKKRLGIIDDMVLEGVVVVPKPAYQDSYIHAIYKALGVTAPWKVQKEARNRLRSSLVRKDLNADYDRERFEIEAVRDDLISEAIDRNLGNEEALREDLRLVLSEYSDLVVDQIVNQPTLSSGSVTAIASDDPYGVGMRVQKSERLTLLTDLNATLEKLVESKVGVQL